MGEIVLLHGTRHEVELCITCGIAYTVPEIVCNEQRRNGGYHYCPNGHQQGWGKGNTEFDKLRRERDRAVQEQARLEQEAREAEQRALKAEAATKRLKKRAAAGVCPCCHRTVSQMQKHMATKHPEYVKSNVVELKRLA